MRRPKLKMDHLSTIICVAAKRNIEDAADELGVTPSAVRKQIDVLESLLGVEIVQSGVDGLCLTEYGQLLHLEAKRTITHALLAEEKIQAFQALKNHRVLIGHSTYLAPKLIALIHQISIDDKPLLRVEHTSAMTKIVVDRVLNGSLHIGLGFLPLDFPELLIRQVFDEPLVVCLPSDHRLAKRAAIYPTDLVGEPFVAVARESLPALHREIESHFLEFGIRISVVADAFAPPEALIYVEQKVGVCLLANSSVSARRGVTARPLATRLLRRRSGVFIREDNHSPLIQRFVKLMIDQAGRPLLNR
jgi:DNA-binding transcriptional LysR family regulator